MILLEYMLLMTEEIGSFFYFQTKKWFEMNKKIILEAAKIGNCT
jgi:hypothetical protein